MESERAVIAAHSLAGSAAFGIAAADASVAAFQFDEAHSATAGTTAYGRAFSAGFRGGSALRIGFFDRTAPVHEANGDEMALDHFPNRGKQRGDIATTHPLPAARVEHGLEFLHHEADIATTAEHRADHARQSHRPGVMLHVLGVDEDFEGATAAAFLDVIDGDVEGVVEIGPADLVGVPGKIAGAIQ